jgi:hypothetical protein
VQCGEENLVTVLILWHCTDLYNIMEISYSTIRGPGLEAVHPTHGQGDTLTLYGHGWRVRFPIPWVFIMNKKFNQKLKTVVIFKLYAN